MNTKLFSFAQQLLLWYDQQGRKTLPWRQEITPYRVWVSEIMLQQTQVKTVIPYFTRFITRFPTIQTLANAKEDEVLNLWTGLGYYARARNLQRAAQHITTRCQGKFPETLEKLEALPGIGRSTAGAILAIAFQKKATILDGNVKRVLTRFHTISGRLGQTQITKQLWEIAEKHTPEKRVADYTQAIMDLGATLCTRTKPLCSLCPMSTECQAYQQNRQAEFPTVKPSKKLPIRVTNFLIFYDKKRNQVLLEKRPPVGIWGGLWSFPECPVEMDITEWSQDHLNIEAIRIQKLPLVKHTFTHFQLMITPIYIDKYHSANCVRNLDWYIWYSLDSPTPRGFASPVKRLLEILKEVEICI